MPKARGTKRQGPTSVRLSKEARSQLEDVCRINKVSQSEAMGQALLWFGEEVLPSLCKPAKEEKGGAK